MFRFTLYSLAQVAIAVALTACLVFCYGVGMRESGFYWVLDAGRWIVAEYCVIPQQPNHPWFISGEDRAFGEHYWDHVDERRIVREVE